MYFHYLIRLKTYLKLNREEHFLFTTLLFPLGKKKKTVYLKFTLELVFVFKGTHQVKPQ